jgi:hypothetical protein
MHISFSQSLVFVRYASVMVTGYTNVKRTQLMQLYYTFDVLETEIHSLYYSAQRA